jgi:dipeptidase E
MAMKTIVITSSGFLRKPIREELLKILPKKRPLVVAYIPTASKVVKDDSYAKKDVEILSKLEMTVSEIDLTEVKGNELERRIRECDFMYVQGGNPYWILKQAKESGFDQIAIKLIAEGMIYIGKSAGAYILAPEVIIPEWLEGKWKRFGLEDVRAMGVIPFVWAAHYEDRFKELLLPHLSTSQYQIRVITNDQGFLVTETEVKIIGIGDEIKLY